MPWRLARAYGLLMIAASFAPRLDALAVAVNGVCYVGDCATPDVLSVGQTLTTPFNFMVTFSNGDQYQVFGIITQTRTGPGISNGPGYLMATYLGNAGNASTPSGADTLVIDLLQNNAASPPSGTQTEGVTPVFGGPAAASSSVSLQVTIANTTLPLIGPYSPGSAGGSASESISMHATFLTKALALGLKVTALEADQKLQEAVLTVHHACIQTLTETPALKIIENHMGVAAISSLQTIAIAR